LTIVGILIWSLADSKTTLADYWIANDAQERFGVVSTGDELPELEGLRELIGKEPEIAEEYDLLD
jgi:hypothetical protein